MEDRMAFVKVAEIGDVPPGRVVAVAVGDKDLALCNVDGDIYAIADVCTHDNGRLGQGYVMGCEIECPRHGARFDVKTGEVRALPAVLPIPRYEVRVDGKEIWVDIA
jgi:3-phenylpropionate/trans-cinnamate dioxygenase ferredoxin subunit